MIERLQVLNNEQPHPFNAESILDLQVIIARQEARALVAHTKAGKMPHIHLAALDTRGHLKLAGDC